MSSEDEDDGEILTIDDGMLHHERVDLEAGMRPVPPATLALIIACTIVYVRQLMIGSMDDVGRVVETGAVHRDEVQQGELWRLVSGGFLHADAQHLIGNMVMLFILGMACEHAFGWRSFLFLYVGTCVVGSAFTMSTSLPTVGASGAIFGLGGAIISMVAVHHRRIELRDHRVALVLVVWSLYTLVLGLMSPMVSNSCHLGGLVGGLILGAVLPPAILADPDAHARSLSSRGQAALALAALIATAIFFLPHLN